MKTHGNVILMTAICIVIFWVFMALRPAQATEIYQCGDVTVTLRATPGYQFITFETDNKKSSTDILGNLRWNWRANRLNGKQCKLKD